MPTLTKGSKGPDVKALQQALLSKRYLLPKFGADGSYGNETIAALGAFLYEHDLRDNEDPLPTSCESTITETVTKAPTYTRGIDVSKYQGAIDFEAVKASGIDLAVVKAGGADDGFYRDRMFTIHYSNARGAGLVRGAYFFYSFGMNPIEQAAKFFSIVGPLQPGDLRPVLDVEDRKTPLFGDKALAHLKACLQEIERLFGCTPILYTSKGVLQAHKIDREDSGLEKYPLWVARYEVKSPALSIPLCYKGEWALWQVGFDNDLAGITGEVDRNFCRVPLEGLRVG